MLIKSATHTPHKVKNKPDTKGFPDGIKKAQVQDKLGLFSIIADGVKRLSITRLGGFPRLQSASVAGFRATY